MDGQILPLVPLNRLDSMPCNLICRVRFLPGIWHLPDLLAVQGN